MNIWNSQKLNRKIDNYLNKLNTTSKQSKQSINVNASQAKPKLTNALLNELAKKQNVNRKVYK